MPCSNHSGTSVASPSPSLTFSVNLAKSSPLPSPRDPVSIFEPQQLKTKLMLDKGHIQPSTRIMSTLTQPCDPLLSPPSPPYRLPLHPDVHPIIAPHSPRQYHSYTPRSGPIPRLHYAAQSLGIMSLTDLTLDQVYKVCCIVDLISLLSHVQIAKEWVYQCSFCNAR